MAEGRFQLTEQLEGGIAAAVHLAYDTDHNTWVAVRTAVRPPDPEWDARARVEAAVMETIASDAVLKGTLHRLPDGAALVLPLARGGTMQDWLERNGSMPPMMAVMALVQLADGVHALHEAGFTHCDLGLSAAKVMETGEVLLGSFDFIQAVDGPQSIEQDVAALGVTLYTATTGHTPASTASMEHDDLHPALLKIVERATGLKGEPYPSAMELGLALVEAAAHLDPVPSYIPGLPDRLIELPAAPGEEITDQSEPESERAMSFTPSPAVMREEARGTPSALPYRMAVHERSTRDDIIARMRAKEVGEGEDDDLPAWAAPTPTPAKERSYTITPEPISPRVNSDEETTDITDTSKLAELETPDRLKGPLERSLAVKRGGVDVVSVGIRVLAAAIIITSVFSVFGVYLGSITVAEREAIARQRGTSLTNALNAEQMIVQELRSLGHPAAPELERLFFAFKDTPGGTTEKIDSALLFAHTLEREWGDAARTGSGAKTESRIRRVVEATEIYNDGVAEWDAASRSLLGGLSIAVGAAQGP
jgi:serine/threonine protein kinase